MSEDIPYRDVLLAAEFGFDPEPYSTAHRLAATGAYKSSQEGRRVVEISIPVDLKPGRNCDVKLMGGFGTVPWIEHYLCPSLECSLSTARALLKGEEPPVNYFKFHNGDFSKAMSRAEYEAEGAAQRRLARFRPFLAELEEQYGPRLAAMLDGLQERKPEPADGASEADRNIIGITREDLAQSSDVDSAVLELIHSDTSVVDVAITTIGAAGDGVEPSPAKLPLLRWTE